MAYFGELLELPPEAAPLNTQTLFNTLAGAVSSNQQQVQVNAQQLQNWERQQGYYSSLQSIFIDTSLPIDIRYLAAIQLKNGIDKYWRKTASNTIRKEEKDLIRSRSIQAGINESDGRLALQNAVVIAKITRFEFPHDWPDAISSVTQHLQDASQADAGSVFLPRVLLIILYIVKELSTAKLSRSRQSLYSAAPEVFQVLAKIYVNKVSQWMSFMQQGGDDEGGAIAAIEQSLLTLRVLRRLVIAGFDRPNRNEEIHQFWSLIRIQFGEMLTLVMQHGQSIQSLIRSQIEKHLIQMSKLHLDMVKTHPAAFPQLPDSIGIARAYWGLLLEFGKTFGSETPITSAVIGTEGDAEDEIPYLEKLSLKGLLILRACAKMVYNRTLSFRYQHAEDKEEKKQSTEAVKEGMLSQDMTREMMETLVVKFFVFRPKDLRDWENEPDEWERREEGTGEDWEFSIRICAEKLFLDLIINNKDILVEPLLNVFHTVATTQNNDILLKDSVYSAIGLSAPVLEQKLDFDGFLHNVLIPEVQVQQPGYNILRRRAAIVIGQWVVIKPMDRTLVYQIFQYLLDKDDEMNDLVVRVTAGRQLRNCLDNWDVQAEKFLPFAEVILTRVMALIQEVELADTKMALLNTISAIVVNMEYQINPFADRIISLLPPLWDQAGDEYLLKQTILGILSSLINSIKDESRRFHSLIIPLIKSSVDPTSETRIYLLDDALELWSSLLAQTSEATPDILDLIWLLFPMFDTASESLKKALEITESYVILAPQQVLENSSEFLNVFGTLLSSNLKREATEMVVHILEVFVQCAENLGGSNAITTFVKLPGHLKLLSHTLSQLKDAHDAHLTSGPNRVQAEIDGVVESEYFCYLATILQGAVEGSVQAITEATSQDFGSCADWLLKEWFAHFDYLATAQKKKLCCLGLTALLGLGKQPYLLSRLQEYITMWTDVLAECMENPEDGSGIDCFVWGDPGSYNSEAPEAPEDVRKRQLAYRDPIHRIHVKDHIKRHLQIMIDTAGGTEAFQRDWLVNVDSDVVQAFGRMGVL